MVFFTSNGGNILQSVGLRGSGIIEMADRLSLDRKAGSLVNYSLEGSSRPIVWFKPKKLYKMYLYS